MDAYLQKMKMSSQLQRLADVQIGSEAECLGRFNHLSTLVTIGMLIEVSHKCGFDFDVTCSEYFLSTFPGWGRFWSLQNALISKINNCWNLSAWCEQVCESVNVLFALANYYVWLGAGWKWSVLVPEVRKGPENKSNLLSSICYFGCFI